MTYAEMCDAEIYKLTCSLHGNISYQPRANNSEDDAKLDAIQIRTGCSAREAASVFAREAKKEHQSWLRAEIKDWQRRRDEWLSGETATTT